MVLVGSAALTATAIFIAVAALAIWDFWRRRTHASGAIATAFCLLAVARLADSAALWSPGARWLEAVAIVAFAATGSAILEHRAALFGLRASARVAAAVALAASAGTLIVTAAPSGGQAILTPARSGAVLVLVAVWSACLLEPAWRLWRASTTVAPVQGAQLRLLAGAYVAMAAVILVTALARGDDVVSAEGVLGFEVLAAVIAVTLYVSLKPPSFLRRSWLRRRTQDLVQQLHPVAAWHVDLATSTSWWSPALRELFGVGPDEPVDTARLFEHVHPDDRAEVEAQFRRMLEDHVPAAADFRLRRAADGLVRWVHGTGDVLLDLEQGTATGVFGTMQDVTAYKQAEAVLQQALAQEQEASERLRRLDELKSAFLSAVSHELRTPLTALKGFGTTLQERASELEAAERMLLTGRIVDNAHRLEHLLGDLLDLDRLERAAVAPEPTRVEVTRIVRRALEAIDLGGRALHLDLPDEGAIVVVDAVKVERIVTNLVRNAADHTPEGTSVWVRVRFQGREVEIVVEDDGPGVPDELKRAIFERFHQGHRPPSRGAGLGLAIVDHFASLHGGHARVIDRDGGGARFEVLLPSNAALPVEQAG